MKNVWLVVVRRDSGSREKLLVGECGGGVLVVVVVGGKRDL